MDQTSVPGAAGGPGDRRFLKPEDVAGELSVTVSQVYTLMRSGQLPAVKIGKRGVWRVSREQLESYVARLEQEAAARVPPSASGSAS